jgi:hypothetical protein
VDVSSRGEVLRVMEIGARNRAVAETKMNERSSRSHSVLTVIVDGISHVTGQRTHGCLHLIDLAGQQSPFWSMSYATTMLSILEGECRLSWASIHSSFGHAVYVS